MTDQNGGGLIRKLAVTTKFASPFTGIFSVKTVFTAVNCNYCEFMSLGVTDLYVSSQAHNVKVLSLSQELSLSYKGVVISGSMGDTTCG